MTNIEIVKTLLNGMGKTVEADKALAAACIVLLDEVMTGKKEATPSMAAAKKETKPKKKLDHGKIVACYKAGWPIQKIADEVGGTYSAVRTHLKKEGLIK